MESANVHHNHQQQDHQVDSSFSWFPNPISNGTANNINSRNLTESMVQDLGIFHSYNGMPGYPFENYVTQELQRLARIKDEFSAAESYPKFLQLLNRSPTSSIEDLHLQPYNDHQFISYSNSQDFSLASFSSAGCSQIKGGQIINNGNSSNQNFPTTTSILSLNQSTTSSSSSAISSITPPFDINCLPALDLFGSPRSFDGRHYSSSLNLNAASYNNNNNNNNIGGGSYYGFDGINQSPAVCPNKPVVVVVSNTGSGSRDDESTKRPRPAIGNAKATEQTVPLKKPKSEPRSSAVPFQVRKEKLGDRIAAIQQLVAPFGKTDTASVLMEAIGYIKFLQTQVQTLSVPYMKSTNKIGGLSSSEERGQMQDGNTAELRSRGLCLVPLSCLSYVVTDGCEGIWPT